MKIAPFGVERWMNEWETKAVSNLAETCVDSLTVGELLEMSGEREAFLSRLSSLRLTYGDIRGSDELLNAIDSLYTGQNRKNILAMNGGTAANFLSMYTLVEPGDEVVCVYPTYQQLYSIPESFGADVRLFELAPEDGFLPRLDKLAATVTSRTKLLCLNNANNPTGSLMKEPLLRGIVEIAKASDVWLYCDEAYRFMVHDPDVPVPSIVDMYDKGIVSCSLSKCFSLAGLRLGWLAGPENFIEEAASRRDYMTISCARIDDMLGALAIRNSRRIFDRNLSIVRAAITTLDEWVKSEPRLHYVKPQAGTTAFVRYDYDIPSEDFCKRLCEKDGTFLLPGRCFGDAFDRYLRIGYAFSPKELKTGLQKVSDFLRELEKEGL